MPEYVYALHDFTPENPDEVPFRAGDKIEVVERDDLYQDGWWQGRNSAGQVGLFPQSYTTSRPPPSVPTEDPRSIPAVEFPPASSPPLQALAEEPEPSTDEHRRTLSQGEQDMQDTLTDVQRAIEQLGRTDDGRRSFSFASSHGDTDRSETETEGEGLNSEDEATTTWHRDARQRLAARAQQQNEERQRRESGGSVPMTPLRISAPPIDVELSESSEEERDETERSPRRLSNRRSASHTPDPRIPHIPERDEGASGPSIEATPHVRTSEMPMLTTTISPNALAPLAESEGGHIEPSEDFIVPSPSGVNDDLEDELPTATVDRLTFPDVPEATNIPLPLSPPPPPESSSNNPTEVPPLSSSPAPITLAVGTSELTAPSAADKYHVPGALDPMTPVSPETNSTPTLVPPLAASPSIQPSPAPTARPAPASISIVPVPFLSRSTSPGRSSVTMHSQPMPSPSISSTGSMGPSSAGIQQTLTPATTTNASIPPRDVSPSGGSEGVNRSKAHPSDWTVDEVVDWLKSKGFDKAVCDIFVEQEITGDVLLELDHNVLKTEFGIMAFGKRARIVNAIAELRRPPSFTEPEHPMQNTAASRTQSFNYGHSHNSSMQSSAMSSVPHSYANSPMAYNGPNFSPAPSSRGMPSAGTGSMNPESPMYMPVPETSVTPAAAVRNGWATSEHPPIVFPTPAPVESQTSFSTAREQPISSAAETSSILPPLPGTGLGLGLPTAVSSLSPESPSTTTKTKSRPSNLVLSPSDANLKATAVGEQSPLAVDERTALSDSETHHAETKVTRRRLFGRSAESTSLKEKPGSIRDTASRHSKEDSPATPASTQAEHTGGSPIRRHSKKRSHDSKPSDRLSLFGGMSMPTLNVHVGSKARKPVPRISSATEEENDRSTLSSFRRIGHRHKSASRPSTANGPELYEKERVQDTLKALQPGHILTPITDRDESRKEFPKERELEKEKPKRAKDPAVLRKRTSSSTDVTTRSPPGAGSSVGMALRPGKSILEQIGTPDHNGWMRKKSENYNAWKLRYFVLKGPHLYCLKSNDPSETKIKGYINILGYKVVPDEKVDPGRYGFRMVHDSDKTHYFSHDEQLVIREWMKALIKSTITRDFNNPVVSSSNIPTIPLTVAQAMNPSPRPPSPTARAATQRAHRRDNPNQLSSRDAEILMSLKSKNKGSMNGDLNGDRPKLDAVFVDEHNATKTSGSSPPTPNIKKTQSKVAPPRPSREMRRALSNNARSSSDVIADGELIEWANSHLPTALQITDPSGPLCSGLALLRLAEDVKGSPSSPPVADSAFPTSPNDERLDGLFRLFDFLLDNDVKMGTVSINDIRQGKREKIIQLLQALRAWEDKRKAIALSLTMQPAATAGSAFMAGPVPYFN